MYSDPAEQQSGKVEGEDWRRRGQARCAKALAEASAVADRLGLLREWARLSDGYLDLAALGLTLSESEQREAARFSLAVSGSFLHLIDDSSTSLPADLVRAYALDTSYRRVYESGTPDGALLRWSTHTRYRSQTQKAAVRALLTMPLGAALMVSMPTGTGKSLLFQIAPALWTEADGKACVVVITPTVALALDHERALRAIPGLERSRALTGQLGHGERTEVLNAFRRGEVPILLLSPEQAFGSAREALLEAAQPAPTKPFGLAAHLVGFFVDEAHIIESWGRSFRPDFQRLPGLVQELRERNPDLRTILLSATLGRAARKELERAYRQEDWLEIHAGVPRYEFDIVARAYRDRVARDRDLMAAIDHAPRPAIVYTNLVEHARTLFETLRERGYRRLALFTGEITNAATRRGIVESWAADHLDLIVATSAFGMGIDKADVRTVIHACLPESPARYYQEIGRAGRDGHQGIGICLWTREEGDDDSDEAQAFGLAGRSWLTREKAVSRWAALKASAERQRAVTWVGLTRRARIDLDALREGLGSVSGDHNRRWNMSLLNLLQRAGAIRVASVKDPGDGPPSWEVEVLDDALFESGDAHDALWNRVEALRDREQEEAFADLRAFRDLLRGQDQDCLIRALYEFIDPEVAILPACGRCMVCRAGQVSPPTKVRSGGLNRRWAVGSQALARGLVAGATVVVPDEADLTRSLPELVDLLTQLGVEQFVVPAGTGDCCADLLARSQARAGLVLEANDWRSRVGWALKDLPTAVFFERADEGLEDLWRRCRDLIAALPHQCVVLVAPSDLRVDGRPLQQVASCQAPYTQDALRELARHAAH